VLRDIGTVVPIDVVWRGWEIARIRVLSLRYEVSAIAVDVFSTRMDDRIEVSKRQMRIGVCIQKTSRPRSDHA
jgi:hypothetical protein